jgi:hypothetical protein
MLPVPDEIITNILSFVHINELPKTMVVCRSWYSLLRQNTVWFVQMNYFRKKFTGWDTHPMFLPILERFEQKGEFGLFEFCTVHHPVKMKMPRRRYFESPEFICSMLCMACCCPCFYCFFCIRDIFKKDDDDVRAVSILAPQYYR